MEEIRICPSILNANWDDIPNEISKIREESDFLHLDIMDNIFVPNLTFDFDQAKEIIAESGLGVDAHLMIHNPDEIAPRYAEAGCKSVTFHIEAVKNSLETIKRIKGFGSRAAVALKPATQFSEIADFIEEIDMVLVMTVEPGFGGQKFMDSMMEKVSKIRKELDSRHLSKVWLQVDGGISLETIELASSAGADSFVAGSAVFNSDNPGQMCAKLRARAIASKLK